MVCMLGEGKSTTLVVLVGGFETITKQSCIGR